MTTDDLLSDLRDLCDQWGMEATDLARNGLQDSAQQLRQCRDELRAMVKRAQREAAKE